MLSLVQGNILVGALFGSKARREIVNQAWRGGGKKLLPLWGTKPCDTGEGSAAG